MQRLKVGHRLCSEWLLNAVGLDFVCSRPAAQKSETGVGVCACLVTGEFLVDVKDWMTG
jgi:hypothetical protein